MSEGPVRRRSPADLAAAGQRAFDRLSSFGVVYVAIVAFLALYLGTVEIAERLLGARFEKTVREAVQITNLREPVAFQIQSNLEHAVQRSPWTRIWGVGASVIVIGRDGTTLLYAGGRAAPPPPGSSTVDHVREAQRLLPATTQVSISLPHNTLLSNTLLVAYAAALLQGLFLYNRALARRERAVLDQALGARDDAARRAARIEQELEEVRQRLTSVEPAEREQADEIRGLQRERETLQAQLAALASREEELRGKAAQAVELDRERRALEELLEEAAGDLSSKDGEIQDLEQRLTRADRRAGKPPRAKEGELLARRLRTLYKTLEIDDRAIDDMAALGDEGLKLKAEENLKRLAEEADNVAVRRKVGGLPGHLSIFELSFAGKGRIYYAKGRQRRFRVLALGGKASQKADLEYLSRLPRE